MVKNRTYYFSYTNTNKRLFKNNIYLIEYNPIAGYFSEPSGPFFTNDFPLGIKMLLNVELSQSKEV